MIFNDFKVYRYNLPFKKPINFNGYELSSRNGLILKLTDINNNIAYSEISPLPGFHEETIDDAIKQLLFLSEKLTSSKLPLIEEILNGSYQKLLDEYCLFPSVQCGLDFAMLKMLAKNKKMPLCELFSGSSNLHIPINAVMPCLREDYILSIRKLIDEGYKTVKIKVGRNDLSTEIKQILDIYNITNGKISIRLDANARWSYDQAEYFLNSIKMVDSIEYIEEPLADYSLTEKLYNHCRRPIALDENLSSYIKENPNSLHALKAFIIKPPILGGLYKTIQLIKLAENNMKLSVISDTFQSGAGLTDLAILSTLIKNRKIAMGLGTNNALEKDVLHNRINIKNGSFNIDPKSNYNSLKSEELIDIWA